MKKHNLYDESVCVCVTARVSVCVCLEKLGDT